jgi:protoheme IX farnesyltransferase
MKSNALAHAESAAGVEPSKWADLFVLTKVRLNSLVVVTAMAGYYLAAPDDVSPIAIVVACVGTALVAAGAAAMNQVAERDLDALMMRTRQRPLPAGRMSVAEGYGIGAGLGLAGVVMLWLGANALAAGIAAATLVIYVWIYTPMKTRTSLATVVGAVPGALPPLIGWAAARGSLQGVAPWTLFFVMFLWQLPHFLAIAWLCRDDYARAKMPMLSVIDRDGSMTGRQAVLWSATLLPFSLLPFFVLSTPAFCVGAIVVGAGLVTLAVKFAMRASDANARLLFYGSIVYLPLLLGLLAAGRP